MIDAALVRFLDSRGVGFCVIGAAAMAAHGWARYTADVDLLTMDPRVLAPEFWPEPFRPVISRGDLDDPLEGVARLPGTTPQHLIVGRGFAMRHAVETARRHEGLGCHVATPEAIVLLKLEAGGPQDRLDVVAFVETQRAIDGAPWLAGIETLVARCGEDAQRAWSALSKPAP